MNVALGLVSSFGYSHTLTLRPKIAPQSLLSDLNPAACHHALFFVWIFYIFSFYIPDLRFQLNCFRNRKSFSKNSRRSFTPYLSIARRSTPKPKAKPTYFWLSMLTCLKTLGCTIPQPSTSSHPV